MADKKQDRSVWIYEEVQPYSAPLTESAVRCQDKKKHNEFVDIMREGVRFRMIEHPAGAMQKHVYNDRCVSYSKKLSASDFICDLRYEDKYIIAFGDAKVNKRDLKDPHTVAQLRAYLEEMALPAYATKDKYLLVCTPHNIGGIARTIVEEQVMPHCPDGLDVEVVYISEYDGKIIPAPEGWDEIDFTEERPHFISSKKYGNVPVIERWVPISEIKFDPENSRLIGVEDVHLTQEQAKAKLLADGDCADTNAAVERRSQMFIGSIREPIWITSDKTAQVGNSRTAYGQYACEITNGHAPGYEMVRVYDFGDADAGMLYDLKQEEQAMTKLDQGRVHDSIDMWRRHTKRGQSIDELYEIFDHRHTKEVMQNAINTVDWLVKNGYSTDDAVMEMYYVAYALEGVCERMPNAYKASKKISRKKLVDTAATAVDPKWRRLKGMSLIVKALQDPMAPKWKIEAVEKFIDQAEGWASVAEWKKRYGEAFESNRYSAKMARRQLATAETSIGNMENEVQHTIDMLQDAIKTCKSPEEFDKKLDKESLYSKNEIRVLQKDVYALLKKVEDVKALLGDAVFEYEQLTEAKAAAEAGEEPSDE